MKILTTTVSLVLIIISFQACTKETEQTEKYDEKLDDVSTELCTINLNKNFQIYGIERHSNNPYLKVEKRDNMKYIYSDKTIQVISSQVYSDIATTSSRIDTLMYYLNQSGLADSAMTFPRGIRGTVYFRYNNDGYLISDSSVSLGNYVVKYEYYNGNRVKESDKYNLPELNPVFQYTRLPNYVDIDNFKGTYLGKLNKNLLLKIDKRSLPTNGSYSTTFHYTLNADDLVIERTAITESALGHVSKIITEFEYTFIP